jgi:hypothetical protein
MGFLNIAPYLGFIAVLLLVMFAESVVGKRI